MLLLLVAVALGQNGGSVMLHNGVMMPVLGFGTASGVREQHVSFALKTGVRLVDTAQAKEWYDEASVGRAVLESRIPRDQLFLTTKMHPRDHGYKATLKAVQQSLDNLGTTYIDGFLLHYPRCFEGICPAGFKPEGTWQESWRALSELYEQGTLRAIGVSNFHVSEFQELLAMANKDSTRPHFVQNWMDPLHQDAEMRRLATEHGVQYQAYSSLGTQWKGRLGWNPVLTHPTLKTIAEQQGASVPRVVLAWTLQRGATAIPASRSEEHVRDLFRPVSSNDDGSDSESSDSSASSGRSVGTSGGGVGLLLDLPETALLAIDALDGTLCNGDVWQCKDEKPFS